MNDGPKNRPLVYLIAGEASGDALGASLMTALKAATGGNIAFAGIGGRRMTAAGLTSLFPMDELSVMGLAEVLPRLPAILRRMKETAADIESRRPDAVVSIDSPGFNMRLAARMRPRGIKWIHYVAPSVWAWKPGRAKKAAAIFDHLLTLLPFEPPLFRAEGLAATFVGHPVLEGGAGPNGESKRNGAAFRASHGVAPDAPVLCVLPGSRHSETSHLLPVLGAVVAQVHRAVPNLRIVVPVAETVRDAVTAAIAAWPGEAIAVEGEAKKFDAFAASDAALAASGTVLLELAIAGLPTVVAYKVNAFTTMVAKRLVRVDHVGLVNILLKREVMPEFLLDRCRADYIAPVVQRLLTDETARTRQVDAFAEALDMIGANGPPPSRRAADAVLDVLGQNAKLGPA